MRINDKTKIDNILIDISINNWIQLEYLSVII